MHKYTLNFEAMKQEFILCKESLVHKIAIIIPAQFDSFIDFEWSNYGLVNNSSSYHHTKSSLLPYFSHRHVRIGYNFSFGPNITSIQCNLRFVREISLQESIFMHFLDQFCLLKIICLRSLPRKCFYRSQFRKYSTLIFLLHFSFFKDLSADYK